MSETKKTMTVASKLTKASVAIEKAAVEMNTTLETSIKSSIVELQDLEENIIVKTEELNTILSEKQAAVDTLDAEYEAKQRQIEIDFKLSIQEKKYEVIGETLSEDEIIYSSKAVKESELAIGSLKIELDSANRSNAAKVEAGIKSALNTQALRNEVMIKEFETKLDAKTAQVTALQSQVNHYIAKEDSERDARIEIARAATPVMAPVQK